MQGWVWDRNDTSRFNPMDETTSDVPHIMAIQAIESIRQFMTNGTLTNDEFSEVLDVALSITLRQDG